MGRDGGDAQAEDGRVHGRGLRARLQRHGTLFPFSHFPFHHSLLARVCTQVAGLPTRFKYAKVEPQAFGLSPAEILMSTDAELNSYMGLKKYAPYRKEGRGRTWDAQRGARLKELKQKLRERGVAGDAGAGSGAGAGGEKVKKRKGKKERMREKAAAVAVAADGDVGAEEQEVTEETPRKKEKKRKQEVEAQEEDEAEDGHVGTSEDAAKGKRRRHGKHASART